MSHRLKLSLFWGLVLLSIGLMLLLILRPELAPSWTGFGAYRPADQEIEPAKTLWDWLQLVLVPVFVVTAAWWLGNVFARAGRQIMEQRIRAEADIAADARNQASLEAYLDKMSDYILNNGLRDASAHASVRAIAEARTLAVLRTLDGSRKGDVVQFLHDSGLVGRNRVISLQGADLSDARLSRADLHRASLWQTNLRGANLAGANLQAADLWLADLRRADLRGANLRGTHLGGANLNGVDLSGADLSKANLRKAILDNANLTRANVTPQQLSKAGSLLRTTLPNGTRLNGAGPGR